MIYEFSGRAMVAQFSAGQEQLFDRRVI
jgi:hypothetical protein